MTIQINLLSASEFDQVLSNTQQFISTIEHNIYIVRGLYSADLIDEIKSQCLLINNESEPSWHPCLDNCPDYHRIHHNYPGAYVKSIQHAYYFHPWNNNNALFDIFLPLFQLKATLSNQSKKAEDYLKNIPSDGPIARILVHQYPWGGGGQEEHIDPVSPYAKIQTIIQASDIELDYTEGGLYVHNIHYGTIFLDQLTQKGDLIIMSPGIRHGVAPINPNSELNWRDNNGRWIIMPIIINSDVKFDADNKPKGLGKK